MMHYETFYFQFVGFDRFAIGMVYGANRACGGKGRF